MSSKDESIEVKIESENKDEKEENDENFNNIYASSDFFMNIIPKTLTKEKFDKYNTELYLKKLYSIKNLLEIEPKSISELQNTLIFFFQNQKEFLCWCRKNISKYKTSRYSGKYKLFFFEILVSKYNR